MKKHLLYALALAATMAACTEDYTDWAPAQQYGQEEAQSVVFTVSPAAAIDLASVETETVEIFVPAVEAAEGAATSYSVLLYNEDKTASEPIATENGTVKTADLQNAVCSLYGRRPVERKCVLDIIAYTEINGQSVKSTASTTLTATPEAPFISAGYYLIGNMNNWNTEALMPFSHSGKDVYEDPVFTIVFQTTAADQYWKIIPQSNVDAGDVWGNGVVGVAVDGDASLEGTLVTDNPQAGKIEKAGMYSMTLNMMDYTYTIKELAAEYYIVGAMQGWNADAATGKTCSFYPQSATLYSYTTQFNDAGNLKIWMANDFGNWDNCYGAQTDGDNSPAGNLVGSGAGAIVCPEPGAFYTITVDFGAMSYTWTKLDNQAPAEYSTIGLIGDFNSWGGDAAMTQVAPHNWYISGLAIAAAGGLKFRANSDWAVNWGATLNVAEQNYGTGVGNGDNIAVPAGTYDVYFNDITGEFVFKTIG